MNLINFRDRLDPIPVSPVVPKSFRGFAYSAIDVSYHTIHMYVHNDAEISKAFILVNSAYCS